MNWWKRRFGKPKDAQLDSEVRFHIERLTEEYAASGMTPEEARRRAALEFGGAEQVKEEIREVHRRQALDFALSNGKAALRFVRKSPSFSAAVILTLAMGIGANSAVFSAIDAILLRPLPFPNGNELMFLEQVTRDAANPNKLVAPVRVEDWNRMNSTFQGITAYYTEDASETSGALPEKITQALVAPRFLQVMGVAPELGRDFTEEEERFGGPGALIISDRYWRRRFGGDPNVVGKKLRFGNSSDAIVGVMPPSFRFPNKEVDLWWPIAPDGPISRMRKATWYNVVGRLRPGVSLEQARADLATVQEQLGRSFPETDAKLTVGIEPLKQQTVGDVRGSLWMLFGAVTLLLLIACTNIVALLLARGTQRRQEIAVRFSLGASRGALIGQLLAEALLLSFLGAALGLGLAGGAARVFRSLAGNLPRVDEIQLDWRLVAYTLACSMAATVLCGLLPAIRGTRRSTAESLAQASRTQVSGRNGLQWLLVGVQVALAVTLLSGAGLLLRSFQELGRVSPGFEMSHVLTFHISGSWGETGNMKALTQRIDRSLEAFANVPGVEAAATAAQLPGIPSEYAMELKVLEGETDPNRKILAENRFVSASYFQTMKIPTLSGEGCREEPNGMDVMVNRTFANTYLGGSNAIGHHLQPVEKGFVPSGEIKGIVGDARETGMNREPGAIVYWCTSAPQPDPYYLVRTSGDPMAMAETLRKKAQEIEPARSVFAMEPLVEQVDAAFSENRLRTILLVFFAVTAVSLACVGLYGTLSYAVNVRRREVGLRLALGALRGQIVAKFLALGLGVTLAGCAAGWALAAASSRLLAGMLYGVSGTDVATLSGVTALVLAVAAGACLAPSVRASRLDPMEVLREE